MAVVVPLVLGADGLQQQAQSGDVVGGRKYSIASTAVSYTETTATGQKIVKVTASGQTITLPTAVNNGAKLTFKLMVAGTLTLQGAGVETIDEGTTAVLTTQYQAASLFSDNANWIVG